MYICSTAFGNLFAEKTHLAAAFLLRPKSISIINYCFFWHLRAKELWWSVCVCVGGGFSLLVLMTLVIDWFVISPCCRRKYSKIPISLWSQCASMWTNTLCKCWGSHSQKGRFVGFGGGGSCHLAPSQVGRNSQRWGISPTSKIWEWVRDSASLGGQFKSHVWRQHRWQQVQFSWKGTQIRLP